MPLSQPIVFLEIDRNITSFSKVWVHLKDECRLKHVPFKVTIDLSQIRTIFDPYDTKPETLSWSEFIQNQIDSLGTFILTGYIKAMAQLTKQEEPNYEWVITKIENISEKTDWLEITGVAEQFDTSKF